jgi:hypothetical protein
MVWGCNIWDGRTDLAVHNTGTLTDQRYIDDILDKQVRLYVVAVGNHSVLMDDNSRLYRAKMDKNSQERGLLSA